jgi:tellurite resistance protein TerC
VPARALRLRSIVTAPCDDRAVLELTPLAWAATIGLVVVLFAVDLFVAGGRAHVVGFREAVGWSLFYVAVALLFGVVFGMLAGWRFGAEYFAGYIVEKSLSVDNLFVFVILMTTFAVPAEHQQRVLTFGILVALVLRAVFIGLGAALLSLFSFMFLIFGLLLIFTAVQLFRHRDQDPAIEDNAMVTAARRILPFTDRYHDGRLVTRIEGRRVLTPLFLVLIAIGSTDVMFALDSIPAVFGVTEEAFIASSPPTPSRCSGCGRSTSSSPACSTGLCTSPRGCRSSWRSSASSSSFTISTASTTASPRSRSASRWA